MPSRREFLKDAVSYILDLPGLTDDQKLAILHGNAARLLRISS